MTQPDKSRRPALDSTPTHVLRTSARQQGDRLIRSLARREVQSFFDDLTSGNPRYRTVASLRGQITQEYRGRCILELLQNAHDALAGAGPKDPRQISFVLTTGPEPELLVANSGRPFRRRDFEGICQLGQSPKDPNKSAGNKGLGFQSVLEVSTRPQIWSTASDEGHPAFAFEFDEAGTQQLVEQALAEIDNDGEPSGGPFDPDGPIIDWESRNHSAYRQRLAETRLDPLGEARDYLSPYSIPLQVGDIPEEVDELLRDGHVTVVRLRLDGGRTGTVDEAIESIVRQLDELDARSTVFLQHLERLMIEVDGKDRVLLRRVDSRTQLSGSGRTREQLVSVGGLRDGDPDDTTREFRVWTRSVGGDDDPEEAQRIHEAARHLGDQWQEVRQVEVAVAVEDRVSPEPGVFVVFLPTEDATGTGAHINARFFPKLDRRQIDFGDEYNALLLEYVTDLGLDVAAHLAAGPPEAWRARAVIDVLASTDSANADTPPALMDRMLQRAETLKHDLASASLILCDDGWHNSGSARIMPDVFSEDDAIGEDRWRESAEFAVVSSELDGRRQALATLLEGLGGSTSPTPSEWANTIERLAARIGCSEIETTWNSFLNSLLAVLPQCLRSSPRVPNEDPLANARFLPTEDGRLLSVSSAARVFFQPRRGVDDAADSVGAVPGPLQARIAFLHRDVETHEGPQQRNTEVQKFLDGRFVQSFRREDLIEGVVIPALPDLPVRHGTPEADHCSQILNWTLALVGRNEPEPQAEPRGPRAARSLPPLLKGLPVACGGGWFEIRDAVFGPGWPGHHGEQIQTLADGLPAEASRRLLDRALLRPDDERWNFAIADWSDVLAHAGVADGLRLETTEPISFRMSRDNPELPREAPEATPSAAWDHWRNSARDQLKPRHEGAFGYELTQVRLLPELHHLYELETPARRALSDLILASLDEWSDGWQSVTVRKVRGHQWSSQLVSPLKHWLTTLPWFDDGERAPKPLSGRWLVPAPLLQGREGRFRHLAPLPARLARRLDNNESGRQRDRRRRGLLAALKGLGLHVYPTEKAPTGPALLEALANAWEEGQMPAGGFNVFLGQVRHAWKHLDVDDGLPKRFLVRTAEQAFHVQTDLEGVYLPDHRARTRSLQDLARPVLEMEGEQARGDAGARVEELKAGVRRASALRERCIADEQPAVDVAKGALLIESSELHWLPPVLLTLAAHGGARTGPATRPWENALERVRNARIQYCDSLTVELMDTDRVVAGSPRQSYWLPDEGVLLRRRGSSFVELAAACQSILDRQDLLKDLRLVLGNVTEPTQTQIERALDLAQIDAETFADIRDRCQGNAARLVERVRPLLRLFGSPDDDLDKAAVKPEPLAKWLSTHLPGDEAHLWPAEEIVRVARSAHDDCEMGREAYQRLGERFQLPAWNEALAELGDQYVTCENSDAGHQTALHIQEAAPLLQALARHVAVEARNADLFLQMERERQDFKVPNDWCARWWEVPFGAVVRALRNAYVDELAVDSGLVEALDHANTLADLRAALEYRRIELEVGPYETYRRNENRLRKEIDQVRDLHRAWLEVSGADPVSSRNEATGSPRMDASAYLRDWSEAEIFKQAIEVVNDAEFRAQCDRGRTVDEARATLGVTPRAIEQARRKRRARQRKAERAKRTFPVAGKPFEVNGPESYGTLLAHLDTMPAPKGPSIKSDEPTRLVHPGHGPVPRLSLAPPSPGGTSHRSSSPHLPDLVGIVGEMHAYRYLRSQFGSGVVTPDAWVSGNGEKVLPPARAETRETNDSHGFDFRFPSDGTTWHFEVKATTEDDTSFSLPPSEIRAATRLANSRRDRWCILRVRRALSDTPEVDWLPNPFEAGSSDLFRLSSRGLKVRYALADTK